MRKLYTTACLALLLVGCERSFQDEATYEGVSTSGWVEEAKNDNVEKRRKAAEVLGELGPTEADLTVPALKDLVADEDAHVRLMALRSLGKIAPKAGKASGAVGRAMSDKNKTVAKEAMRTLRLIEMAKPSALNGN